MKSVLNFLTKNRLRGSLIVSGFAIAMLLIAVTYVKSNKQTEVRHISAVERPGYEPSPAYYIVEASPNKKWKETSVAWFILGFIIAAGSGFAIWYDEYKPVGPRSNRTGYMILVLWFLAFAVALGPYVAKHGDSSFQSKICVDEYRANQDNLDDLFPRTDKTFNCN